MLTKRNAAYVLPSFPCIRPWLFVGVILSAPSLATTSMAQDGETPPVILDAGLGYQITLGGLTMDAIPEAINCRLPLQLTMQTQTSQVVHALARDRSAGSLVQRSLLALMQICRLDTFQSVPFEMQIIRNDERLGALGFSGSELLPDFEVTSREWPEIIFENDPMPYLEGFYRGYPRADADRDALAGGSASGLADHTLALALSLELPAFRGQPAYRQSIVSGEPQSLAGLQVDVDGLNQAIAQGHPVAPMLAARQLLEELRPEQRQNLRSLSVEDQLTLLHAAALAQLRGSFSGYRLGRYLQSRDLPVDAALEALSGMAPTAQPGDIADVLDAEIAPSDRSVSVALNHSLYVEGCNATSFATRNWNNGNLSGVLGSAMVTFSSQNGGCVASIGAAALSFNVIRQVESNCIDNGQSYSCSVGFRNNCHAFNPFDRYGNQGVFDGFDILNLVCTQISTIPEQAHMDMKGLSLLFRQTDMLMRQSS